ncbi:hypothetical protein Ahy_A01g002629 [Arachis hypogaea]|uniref:Replication protein A 70 kDa DNA-binding subunit B/D first OB fold domain-containing protein n=1 Tax=Arachis hypogaea TaxID=3818 RepID=A0A445ERD3_ARAHY|nr:hypothetical protein Ahy_A01g002629 [Arachis hypogaea]
MKLNKIQCTLKKEVINQFGEILKEGELYSISRITVVLNIGAAKVVKHRYKLLFRFDTEVIPISNVHFPKASYSLETVESVVHMGQDSIYLIDVMGFLISVRDYSDVELDNGKKFKLVLIQLYSNGSYLICNLLGNFLTKMRLALMNAVSQPPIILLQSVKVKIYEGKVVVQNVIDCSKIIINPDISKALYFIDSITLGNGFVVADVDDDFVNLFMNGSIKELRENDADGFFNFVAKIKSLCNNFDWWYYSCVCGYPLELFRSRFSCFECARKIKNAVKKYKLLFKKRLIEVLQDFDAEHSVVYATPYPPFFDDVIGKKVRLLPSTVFSPIHEDVIQNPQPHDEISSLGGRISVTSDNIEFIEVDMEALGAAYKVKVFVNHTGGCNALILHDGDVQHLMGRKCSKNEQFHLDASNFLYKLIGKKLVFMVDPQPVESDTICPAYNVFKVSTHDFMLNLIERVENCFLNARAIVSTSNVASIEDPVSHISGSVLPAHKSVRVVNEIICNKRLASPYRDVPRLTKQKLEDAFSRSINETWDDNEEASSSMNI